MVFFRKIVFSLLATLLLFTSAYLSAQTVVVTTNAGDESNGSLGWAVTTLNNAGAGAISIGNVGPITLTQPLSSVSQTVTFQGVGAGVIGQDTAQSQFLFQQGFTLANSAALTFTNNGGLSSGLDAALTAASWNLSSNSSFSLTGGVGVPGGTSGNALVTLGNSSTFSGSSFQIQGGAGATGTGLGGGDGGAAAVSATSLTLAGATGTMAGGTGGADSYQVGNGGSATLLTGSLNMSLASQLTLTGGSAAVSTGSLGNGGSAVLGANSVSLTGAGTQLTVSGGTGGSPQTVFGSGLINGGDGGSVSINASSVTVASQALFNITGGAGGSVSITSTGHGGIGGSLSILLGNLNLAGGSLGVTAGAGGQGARGWIGGSALVTVGSINQATSSTLSIVGGAGGGNTDGGTVNLTMDSQTLASGATFIAVGGAGGSGAVTGGNGGSVIVGAQALTLSSGSFWEAMGGAAGTGTSANGIGGNVDANLSDLEGSGTVSLGGPGSQTLRLTNGDFSGVIEGNETVMITGYGVVTLTGANTYSGGTSISPGRLIVNGDSNLGTGNLVLDGGTLQVGANFSTSKSVSLAANGGVFDVTTVGDGVTLNSNITGVGGLEFTGGGLYTLYGFNSYTGPTTVTYGTVDIAGGQIAGAVTVANSGVLTGTGTVQGAVTSNGTMQAGNGTPGSSMSIGSYTQGPNGTFNAVVSPTQSNYLSVNGNSALAGSLSVNQTAGTYSGISYRYDILTSWGGSLTGNFSTLNANLLANWGASVTYSFDTATLALYRLGVDFTPWATGANQIAVAQALNAAVSTGNSDMAAKLNEIYALPSGQGAVLGQLKGDIYTALPRILLDNLELEDDLIFDRLDGEVGKGMGDAHANLVRNILSAEVSGQAANAVGLSTPGARGLWVENTDSSGTVNGDGNVEGFSKSNYGFLAGFDTELFDGFNSGLMGGWVHTDVTGNTWGEKAGVDSADFAVYGSKKSGAFQLNGVAGVCVDHFTVNRSVSIGGDINPLSPVFEGSRFQGALQAEYAFDLSGFTVKPLAGLQYAHSAVNRFSETNSASLGLSVPAFAVDSLRPSLGLEGNKYFTLDQDLGVLPRVKVSASQELIATADNYQEFLSGARDNPFTMTGITPSATTIGLEAGVKVVFGKQLNLFANYQGHFSGTGSLNTFNGGLDISF